MSITTARRTGVIGLGAMGLPMAATLARKGFSVTAFDLDEGRRAKGAEAGLAIAALYRGTDLRQRFAPVTPPV
jgi:3-hydroxyisobutyrate dehydrogenase-like beta-hydroxyacid dehydrogenase